jgi:hypothetical protein
MSSKKEILDQLSQLSSPSEIGYELEGLMAEAAELEDPDLLQQILSTAKKIAEKNYKANIVIWTCMALYCDQKQEAHSSFESTPLDDPEEFDDVYSEATRLLSVCDCSEDEIENLQRDAEAMFDEDGNFLPDWRDNL